MLESRRRANQTRWAAGRSTKLLSAISVLPDPRVDAGGRLVKTSAYDLGSAPPPLPVDAPGRLVQRLDKDATLDFVLDRLGDSFRIKPVRPAIRRILEWLEQFPGATWEGRWLSSGADAAPRVWRGAVVGPDEELQRKIGYGANALIAGRVLRPSYGWQLASKAGAHLPEKMLTVNDPETAARLRALPAYRNALLRHQFDAEGCLSRVMIRTGRRLDQLDGEHLLHYADVVRTSGRHRREHLAWELMVTLGPFAREPATLRAAWSAKGNTRQHSAATLVDRYGIPPSGVRDVLVDYLSEIKAGMDYGSLQSLAYRIARLFWWEVLQINPAQKDLRLDPATAATWRERLAVTTDGQPRREIYSILFAIRGFYRDLAEWSHDEPVRWGTWVAPCPVARRESKLASKAKRQQRARTQDRTRALTPLLPALVAEAARRRDWAGRLHAATLAAAPGEEFTVDGTTFRRTAPRARPLRDVASELRAEIVSPAPRDPEIRLQYGLVNVTQAEADGFWAWAIVETLRHTGVRIEELLELTQLSLRHYTSQTTGTLVPLLHIVPSKTDAERLIPMSPELVTVLLEVQRRAKAGGAHVPLSVRYDPHERIHGEPFPHLFARRIGTRQEVISYAVVRRLLNELAADAGLTDAGQPIRFTPHDFRRLFTTEMVSSGLPLHIAATLLGHLNLDTTRGYTAVFPEEVIAAHQFFVERRRTLRPFGEMRPASGEEWDEFEDHFLLRKVALGDCHRPYGTPCVHEHACSRCRFLRVDPAQLPRIEEMTCNAEARLTEARDRAWLGEVAALEESLKHLRQRRAEAEHQLTTAAETR
jgi:integrase